MRLLVLACLPVWYWVLLFIFFFNLLVLFLISVWSLSMLAFIVFPFGRYWKLGVDLVNNIIAPPKKAKTCNVESLVYVNIEKWRFPPFYGLCHLNVRCKQPCICVFEVKVQQANFLAKFGCRLAMQQRKTGLRHNQDPVV